MAFGADLAVDVIDTGVALYNGEYGDATLSGGASFIPWATGQAVKRI